MVGLLTLGNRKFEALDGTMRGAVEPLHMAMQQMIALIDKDTVAFTEYMVGCSICNSNNCLFIAIVGCTSVTKGQCRRKN